jgi:DNA-binding MarR family transcriptional regulator
MPILASLLASATYLFDADVVARARRLGLSETEWRLLTALAKCDGPQMSELAQRAMMKKPTLSKAIDGLERRKLAARFKADQDRRRCRVLLTERGRQAAERLLSCASKRQREISQSLTTEELQRLQAGLSRLISFLEGTAPPKGEQLDHRTKLTSG